MGGDAGERARDHAKGIETIAVHAGRVPGAEETSLVPPIHQSATFTIPSVRAGAELMRGERTGPVYTRLGNPTTDRLESILAKLENGAGALVTGSGMAASATILLGLLERDDRVVCAETVYGGTRELLDNELRRFGVAVEYVNASNLEDVRKSLSKPAALLWIESPANPNLTVSDIRACSSLAREKDVVTVVDNTFATPVLQRPLDLGADIVMHSLTKAINGHSDIVAGAVIARDTSIIDRLRRTRTHLGGVADPHQAWLVLRGIKTLPMRVRAAQENARHLAERLVSHPAVSRVRYPGLERGETKKMLSRQMEGPGTMLAIEHKGGAEDAVAFLEQLEIFTLAGSLGGLESLAMHPASMSHVGLSAEALASAGISPGLVRLSVGCESREDLVRDVFRALDSLR